MTKPLSRSWLEYKDAAAYAGISERSLRRAVHLGKVEVTRLGRRTLFTHEAIDHWVDASTQKVGA